MSQLQFPLSTVLPTIRGFGAHTPVCLLLWFHSMAVMMHSLRNQFRGVKSLFQLTLVGHSPSLRRDRNSKQTCLRVTIAMILLDDQKQAGEEGVNLADIS